MALLFGTHTLNIVFLPKSFSGGPVSSLKGQGEGGGGVPTGPPDPHLEEEARSVLVQSCIQEYKRRKQESKKKDIGDWYVKLYFIFSSVIK